MLLRKVNKLSKVIPLLAMLLVFPAHAHEHEKVVTFETEDLGSGLFVLIGKNGFAGGNVGVSVGAKHVVVIDNAMPNMKEKLLESLNGISNKPVNFLINTHVHGDHTGNNAFFGDSSGHLIAHENLRRQMVRDGVNTPNGKVPAPSAALPAITYSEKMSLHLDGRKTQLVHLEKAHTDGDTVILFEEDNVIHAGDLFFNGLFPFIDYNSGGSLDGYIAAQEWMYEKSDKNTKIIPGHGPVAGRNALKASIDMLKDARQTVMALKKKGLDNDAILTENPLAKYHEQWNWGFISTEKMTVQVLDGIE